MKKIVKGLYNFFLNFSTVLAIVLCNTFFHLLKLIDVLQHDILYLTSLPSWLKKEQFTRKIILFHILTILTYMV